MANEQNIAVDIGNTRIKSGVFRGTELVEIRHWEDLDDLRNYFGQQGYRWVFSTVAGNRDHVQRFFTAESPLVLAPDTPLPIGVDYGSTQTLGMDRLAAAVGAWSLVPGQNLLVVDAGSCITYDLVIDNTFIGGAIAPGLRMRMKAMAHFARQLPDISPEWESIAAGLVGKTTRECLRVGAFDGLLHELNGFIRSFKNEYNQLTVVLTGGDGPYFESKLKEPIFAASNLVLTGLNRILNHNQ